MKRERKREREEARKPQERRNYDGHFSYPEEKMDFL